MRKSKREATKNFVNYVIVPFMLILLIGWLIGVDSMEHIESVLTWLIITFLVNNGLYKVVETLKPSILKSQDSE